MLDFLCMTRICCLHRNAKHSGCPCVFPDAFPHFTVDPPRRPSCTLGHRLSSALLFLLLLLLFALSTCRTWTHCCCPRWLASLHPKECLTLGCGWICAVPAPAHVQLILMGSSRSGSWASSPAVIGTCLGGQCQCVMGQEQSLAKGTLSPSSSQQPASQVWVMETFHVTNVSVFKVVWCT